jgi:hypothetical protein
MLSSQQTPRYTSPLGLHSDYRIIIIPNSTSHVGELRNPKMAQYIYSYQVKIWIRVAT